ncbi:hypothetical protein FRC17_008873 [Serendipita sp. 399]|nr:hypothetical protein FRC17_008873 [Serendipita sp. 399]
MQRSIFNQLEMLELFQVSTSTSTTDIHHPFSTFLSSLHHLHTIRMRRTTIDYLEVLGAREGETWAIQGDSLQVLELSSMVENREDGGDYDNDEDEDEDDDFEPVAMQVLAEMLVELFEERKGHWNVKRLHLDEEWDPSRGESLLESLRALGEEWAPIVHWDARAPFFHDYYDSGEI